MVPHPASRIDKNLPALATKGIQADSSGKGEMEEAVWIRKIIESSDDAIISRTLDGVITSWNPAAERILGFSAGEVIGQPMAILIPVERGDEEVRVTAEIVRGQVVEHYEMAYRRKDGGLVDVSISVSPIKDSAGNVIGVSNILRDISDRRQGELLSDRFFSLSVDLLCISTADGYFLRVSPGVTDMLGWSIEEFMAQPYIELVHPDDRVATLGEIEKQIVGGQKVLRFENRCRHKDGSWRVLSWRSAPYPGGLTYAIARDVTVRKHLEEDVRRQNARLRALFEALPGLYLVLKPDLTIVTATDAYLQATMTQREEIAGRGLFEVFPDNPDDPAATGVSNLRRSLDQVAQTGRTDTMAIQKYDVRRVDGSFEEKYWSPINSAMFGTDGTVEYLIHRVEDVTDFVLRKKNPDVDETDLRARLERMEAEMFQSSQQVQIANHQLHAVNKELEAFSYSVSHDLRAPLRHILGFADMLRENVGNQLDPVGQRYLTTISKSAKRMGMLIDDLLAFSRMGRMEMRLGAISLESVVRDVIEELRIEMKERNVIWKYQGLATVRADPALLRIVLSNLLSNAVKYTRPRNPAEIEIASFPSGEGEITVSVRDNGVGFDMAYVGKLFGVFQRLHRAEEFEGTGIGLANVQRIIARHGGRVWAEGQSGKGAAFYFTLPVPSADAKPIIT